LIEAIGEFFYASLQERTTAIRVDSPNPAGQLYIPPDFVAILEKEAFNPTAKVEMKASVNLVRRVV